MSNLVWKYQIIIRLCDALNRSWSAETAMGEWTAEVPSMNQCAVTALVVQIYLGGELVRCQMTDGDSHYWNRLPTGEELDFTEEQFEHCEAQPLRRTAIVRDREYVMSFPETVERYRLLKKRIDDIIG